jgi:hypothetical protein
MVHIEPKTEQLPNDLFAEEKIRDFVQILENAWNEHDIKKYAELAANDIRVSFPLGGKFLLGIGQFRTDCSRSEEMKQTRIKYRLLDFCTGNTYIRGAEDSVVKVNVRYDLLYLKDTSGNAAFQRKRGEVVSGYTVWVCHMKKTTRGLEIAVFNSI